MRRAALSLDLVLSVLMLFQIFAIADSFSSSAAQYAERMISKPSCLVVANAAALSASAAKDVFGSTAYYDFGTVDSTYSVSVSGNKVRVIVYGVEDNYDCTVSIP